MAVWGHDMEAATVVRDDPQAAGAEPEEVALTVVFTDIEGSTAINERLGDEAWLELLLLHNEIVRDRVWRHGGREVKATGDGFMLVFERPLDAARCAISIQRVLADLLRRYSKVQLPVRLGIHHGPVLRDRFEVFGCNVNLAQNIMSMADGGEILVSADFRELVEGESLQFEDSPAQRVYGLSWRPATARTRA